MSKTQSSDQSAIVNGLSLKLVDLVKIFEKGGPANNFHWWNSHSPQLVFTSYESYKDGLQIFCEVVQDILKLNPDMLTEKEVERELQYEFLAKQVLSQEPLTQEELSQKAREYLIELLEPKYQDVDIPIANLQFDGPPFKLAHVTLMPITGQYRQSPWKDSRFVPNMLRDSINMFARVHAPGVKHKAYSYAITQVRLAMNVLRAFCFPFNPEESDSWQVGVVGDTVFARSIPMILNKHTEAPQLGPSPIVSLEFRTHLLSKLESRQWDEINCLLQKSEQSRSLMEEKLLGGIYWLAEATMPDSYQTRFVKIAFALETLVGGEPKKAEDLKAKGIAAMLAERAAFIAGKDLDDRLAIDRDIRTYYGMRSRIVHGDKRDVSLTDIDGFGILVRRVSLALLEKLDELKNNLTTVENLASWVKTQRYSLPGQS